MAAPAQIAYLSVVQWPQGWSLEQRVALAATAAGLDGFIARQRVIGEGPMVLARGPEGVMRSGLAALRGAGVLAFVATQSELNAMPDPLLVREMAWAEGGYSLTLWRTDEWRLLRMSEVRLILRAALVEAVRDRGTARSDWPDELTTAWVLGVPEVAIPAAVAGAISPAGGAPRATTTRATHRIEIEAADGQRYRIDGDKFAWGILADQRAQSDSANATRLALRLAREAPGAVVDTGYERFRAPKGILVMPRRAPVGTRNVPEFEFYCRWASVMYRRLADGS